MIKLSPFAKRVRHCFSVYGNSRRSFAEQTGFSPNTLASWAIMEKDRTPDKHLLQELCECFLQVGLICDLEWLVSGEVLIAVPSVFMVQKGERGFPEDGLIWLQLNALQEEFRKERTLQTVHRVLVIIQLHLS